MWTELDRDGLVSNASNGLPLLQLEFIGTAGFGGTLELLDKKCTSHNRIHIKSLLTFLLKIKIVYLERLRIVMVLAKCCWANSLKPWYTCTPLVLGRLLSGCRLELYNAYIWMLMHPKICVRHSMRRLLGIKPKFLGLSISPYVLPIYIQFQQGFVCQCKNEYVILFEITCLQCNPY